MFGLVKMMLKIKRVPTVVSNYQKEEVGEAAPRTVGGCGRNCLKSCCIQGTICFFYVFFFFVAVVAMHVLLFSLVMGLWIKKINFCDFGYCFVNRCKATFVCF